VTDALATALSLTYAWIKAGHVIFVIFWIAGLFILPRFYVYHHETTPGSAEDRAWIEREDRVRTIILAPAMIVVWILGLTLAYVTDAWMQGWFQAKLLMVIGLSGYQGWLATYGKRLASGKRPLDNRTLRIMNEIPGVATAIIVVLVIVKPF
jgi:protoporphyrinogen IX oxidase